MSQDGVKKSQDGAKKGQDGTKMAQDGASGQSHSLLRHTES